MALLVIIMMVLSLSNLANRYLWYDEAHTALMGRNVLEYGVPKVWNGEYLITTSNGNDFNDSLIIVKDGWVQYYLAALAELLSPLFNVRVCFVVFGIAGAFVLYYLSKELYKKESISILTMALYCLSIPIILYIRQVRYYSPSIFFILLTLHFYLKAIRLNKTKHWVGFTFSAIFLYHSLYMFFIVVLLAISLRYGIYDRAKNNIFKLIASYSFIFLGTFPFFLYNQIFLSNIGDKRSSFQGIENILLQVPGYLWQLNTYFFPFLPLFFICIIIWIKKKITYHYSNTDISHDDIKIKQKHVFINRSSFFLVSIIVINVSVVSAFSLQYATRYILPSILAGYILCAKILYKIISADRLLGTILTVLIIFTNIVNVSPYLAIKYLMPENLSHIDIIKPPVPYFIAQGNFITVDTTQSYLEDKLKLSSYTAQYLAEITHNYDDATEGIVKFLQDNAKPGDTVQGDDFTSDSIAYYTDLHVVNRLKAVTDVNDFWFTIYSHLPNLDKYMDLTYYPEDLVDWLVYLPDSLQAADAIKSTTDTSKYEIYELHSYPNSPFAADIWEHGFTTDFSYPIPIILKRIT